MDNHRRRTILVRAAIALVGIFFLWETSDNEAYYSDGGKATLARFLLEEARPELFREVTALDLPTFDALVAEFRRQGLLVNGRSVTVEEQVLMFLDGVVSNNSMRQTAVKYRRGLYTVQRYFHDVLDALVALYPKYVNLKPPKGTPERLQDPKYAPFKKCLGALEGVFIPVTIPVHLQAPYRNRKQFVAQNVLAVVNFNFEFVYLLAGWEGSAHDSTVLADAFTKDFTIPNGKYYLADAGYGLQKGILTPYRPTRYNLKEQAAACLRPATPKELYNLRNMVERIFGCMKAKFKILRSPSKHDIDRQVQLVYALAALWNFLRRHQQLDDNEVLEAEDDLSGPTEEDEMIPHRRTKSDDAAIKSRQARLAEKLWAQYQGYLACR